MTQTVKADNGADLPLDSLPWALVYAGALLETITVVYAGQTYVQTYTNNGTQITAISRWEVQP